MSIYIPNPFHKDNQHLMALPKILQSSIDPNELALTVKGILVGIIPVILIIAGVAHWNVGQADLTAAVDAIGNIITAVGAALSAMMILVGVIRKILVATGFIKIQ